MNYVIESIGYLGSALVVVSMLMTSVKKLRIVNTVGSVIFTAYAIIIHSYPTALMNTCLVAINIINIVKLYKADKSYTVIECFKDEFIVQLFLRDNLADINKFFPEFKMDALEHKPAYLVCTGSTPIGISIGSMEGEAFAIELDYTIPTYRDYSVAKYMHGYMAEKNGIHKLIFKGKLTEDNQYLKALDFKNVDGVQVKDI